MEIIQHLSVHIVMRLLKLHGFSVRPPLRDEDSNEPMVFICERDEVETLVELKDAFSGGDAFETIRFLATMPVDGAIWDFWYNDRHSLPRDTPSIRLEKEHNITGGVTIDWLHQRIVDWADEVLQQREAILKGAPEPSGSTH